MAVDDVYRMGITATGIGAVYMNVLAIRMKTEPAPTPALFQVLADGWKDVWRPSQSNSITWRSWRATQLYGGDVEYDVKPCNRVGGLAFEANLTGTVTGAISASEALPPQCALVVTLGSAYIGRRKRGRVYGFGLVETDQTAGGWVAGTLTTITAAFTTFFNKYKDGGTDANFELGTWSERTAFGCEYVGNPPVHTQVESPHPELAFTPTSSFTVRNYVNTQRRRAVGVGR